MKTIVLIKKLHKEAKVPEYKTLGATGFDIASIEDHELINGCPVMVRTGLAMQVVNDASSVTGGPNEMLWEELQIRLRSSLAKAGVILLNSPATIDADYTGEIVLPLMLVGVGRWGIKKGERFAQGVISTFKRAHFQEVKELMETERGEKGFGSTGK